MIAWHNELVGEFERGSRELCDAYGAEEPAVVRYLQGVQSAIVGIAEWQLGAPRYSEAAKRRARLTTSGAGGRAFASSLCVDPASETTLRRFHAAFGAVRGFLRDDLAAYVSPERVTDIDRMIDYTCGGGKLLRGMLVVEAASLLVDAGDPDREVVVAQAQILGWCAELLQAYFLVIDDILDESELRRGKPCWHRVPSVGPTNAICDGMLLRSFVYHALERWFLDSAHYVEFVGLFNLCTYATELGQAVDTDDVRAHHVSQFNMRRFQQIARNKTAYYTYVLPLELALGVTGCLKRCDRALLRRLCALMGEFYQAQNDMLDFHSDARTTGKEGTDIAENKPTWLVATAMERARPEQWAVVADNYGRRDAPCVAAVRAVYEALDVRRLFAAYARATEAAVRAMIAGLAQESPVVGRVCDLAWDKTRLAGASLLEVADPP